MKHINQNTQTKPTRDIGDYTHDRKRFYWNPNSHSVELFAHWVECRGHRIGYDAEVIGHE